MSSRLRDNLQPTDFADAICRVTDWQEFDGNLVSAYRIWACRCSNHWFQRHEWIVKGRNQAQIDDWIYNGMFHNKSFSENFIHDGLKLIRETEI